jgi:hypothetical protein
MLRPRSGLQQWIESEEYVLNPSVQPFEFTDDYGNLCQRLIAPPGDFSVATSARLMTVDASGRGAGRSFRGGPESARCGAQVPAAQPFLRVGPVW